MDIREDLAKLVEMTKRYLSQQEELGWEEAYLSKGQDGLKEKGMTLADFYLSIKDCRRCGLAETRANFVFGTGSESAELVFVGEAPGQEEDLQGEPFVGRAGQLLTRIIESIGFRRKDVYIANILKCRPPGNRDPLPEEIEKCEPYLVEQLRIIEPKVICALGRVAAQTLLRTKTPLSKLRGTIHNYLGIKLITTYHPAALLRYTQYKRPTWEDMQLLRKVYDQG